MAKKKKQYVEEGIFNIYPAFPVLIKNNVEWDLKEKPLHFHYYLEIGYCIEGRGSFGSNNKHFEIAQGDLMISAANILHTIKSEGNKIMRCAHIYIDLEDLIKLFPEGEVKTGLGVINESLQDIFYLAGKKYPEILWIVEELIRLNENKKQNYKQQIIGLLYALLFKLYDELSDKRKPEKIAGQLPIMPAIEYIYEHYNESIKVAELAKVCHFSESYFRKVFLEMKGMGPIDYLNSIRIREARRMLLNTSYTVRVVGEKCGYSTVTTFERNFKQRTGMLPAQWRESQRNPRKIDETFHEVKRNYQFES